MKASLRITLSAAFAWALVVLSPYSSLPAHAIMSISEIVLNSSTVQVVHNPSPSTDVLNMSLDITSFGDAGSCDGGKDDLLEGGVGFELSSQNCSSEGILTLEVFVTYVEHDIEGAASYGTSFETGGGATLASKIVPLATPAGACGRWKINVRVTGLNLSSITSSPIALLVDDFDDDARTGTALSGPVCFNVFPQIGNGIVKPHHGVHRIRH